MTPVSPEGSDSTSSNGSTDEPQLTITRWSQDLDKVTIEFDSSRPDGTFTMKGRCTRCWGGLMMSGDADEHIPSSIVCRVCRTRLAGAEARDEYKRMNEQTSAIVFSLQYGFRITRKYPDNATFVFKIFPYVERQTEEEFRRRVDITPSGDYGKDPLTRRSFPAGSVGFLALQAQCLMSAVNELPWSLSVIPSPTLDNLEDPQGQKRELFRRLGCTLGIAMNAAFVCELAMKSICLTFRNVARKTHDLLELFEGLPCASRKRIKQDFPGIESVIEDSRHVFGKWRYFEVNMGEKRTKAMIKTTRAFDLAKAARVLLDETEIMGVAYSIKATATQNEENTSYGKKHVHVKTNLDISGSEAPSR